MIVVGAKVQDDLNQEAQTQAQIDTFRTETTAVVFKYVHSGSRLIL